MEPNLSQGFYQGSWAYDHTQIRTNFLSKADFSPAELDMICNRLQAKKIKKRRTLFNAGSIPQYVVYVNKGLLRMFSTEADGIERTIDLAIEDTWLADLEALYERKSASVSIEALEDAEVFMLHHDDIQYLHQQIPALVNFSRLHAEEKFNNAMKRLQTMNHPGYTAEQRVTFFENIYPSLTNRVPSNIIASLLGFSAETYSRIKRSRMNNKGGDV
jgi:CRP/FNR family transcriptional regulator